MYIFHSTSNLYRLSPLDNKYPLLTEIIPSSLHGRITHVVKYIDANFSEKINLEQVAQLVFISPAYLSRNFRAITGFTFVGYIQHVRIRHAKHLLLESNKKMSEIAAAVGFDNFTYFNRTFKKLVLTNPLKYRMDNKTHQKN
ncbi:hypothetical protein ASL11_14935 [Paenibacillus sp. Soil750]|nr:hypothetical protein ASL11_14935 [Paenibacillus sp. Soil750]